jgi:NAD(P)-dependent dehydrogenase (short-subunit alcohol dehydrogenase family)
MGIVDGRVVVVTGAGRGIGRAHALAFAAEGAHVVVNDIGTGPANEVVDEITSAGGEAVVNRDDIADWDGASSLIQTAVNTFGGLDVLVNNAGFIRGSDLADTSEADWDAVIRVHLKGHFTMLRHAAQYWRGQTKLGAAVDARIINTSSAAGLQGSVGQGNYSAAKAGIAALTLVAAAELGRYGVTVNAIAPSAPDERGGVHRHDGSPRQWLRPEGTGEHLAAGGVARQRQIPRHHREGLRSRGRPDPGCRRVGARPADRQGRPLGPRRGRSGRHRPSGQIASSDTRIPIPVGLYTDRYGASARYLSEPIATNQETP